MAGERAPDGQRRRIRARVPGTEHGDWWSMNGWWIFAGTAAVGLLSKYVVTFRGRHIFNPSNFGLVLCFVLIGPSGPIRCRSGGARCRCGSRWRWCSSSAAWRSSRLQLVPIAAVLATFAAGIAVLAATGHEMTAAWHLGPIGGLTSGGRSSRRPRSSSSCSS